MKCRDLRISTTSNPADGHWDSRSGAIFVSVRKTNSVRDVRDAFLALAYLLSEEAAGSRAACVIVDSRLSHSRLQEELDRFRTVIHPTIADRIHFLLDKGESRRNAVAFSGSLQNEASAFYQWLGELVATSRQTGRAPQIPARQLVMTALAQLRLWNQAPVTVKHLREICGVSYPTVAAVLKALAEKGWLEGSGDRGVRLRHLTTGEWMDLAGEHAKQRKVHFYTDPTGQGSPDRMAKRLTRLHAERKLPESIRIGGVLGASRHFPGLDITAAPRLDLSVDADAPLVASIVDAGLVPRSRPEQRIALAVHVTRSFSVLTDVAAQSQGPWAGELECLADLIEMGFTREATEMARSMESNNKRPSA